VVTRLLASGLHSFFYIKRETMRRATFEGVVFGGIIIDGSTDGNKASLKA
jgi:hypothetical protein